jgi:hypothetical protein
LEFAGSEKRELQTIKQIEKLIEVRRMFVNNSPSSKSKKPDLKFEDGPRNAELPEISYSAILRK